MKAKIGIILLLVCILFVSVSSKDKIKIKIKNADGSTTTIKIKTSKMASNPQQAMEKNIQAPQIEIGSKSKIQLAIQDDEIISPCPEGSHPTENTQEPIIGSCGPQSWQVKFGFKDLSQQFGSCCAQHDRCYGTCGGPNFLAHKKQCDEQYLKCAEDLCIQNAHVPKILSVDNSGEIQCRKKAIDLYNLMHDEGFEQYNSSQQRHCSCSIPTAISP